MPDVMLREVSGLPISPAALKTLLLRHRLLAIPLAVAAVAAVAVAALVIDAQRFLNAPLGGGGELVEYRIEPGYSVRRVGQQLAERGLLKRPRYWELYARYTGAAKRIHAGEYLLDPSLTPVELLQRFTDGQVKQYGLTLIEGWTFAQLLAAVARNDVLEQTLGVAAPEQVMAALGYPGVHPEGRFLPDTYHFPRGTTDVEFLQRAYRAMEQRLAEAWRDRIPDTPLASPYEALILASIVERETAVPDERAAIAGVFIERLKSNMYLQTDPTVIYGMGERYKGNIRHRDLRHDTPYNTYTRKGLPPTPIAMPSGAAIDAVLHPVFTGHLYFVARGDGTHKFSRTLQEHNRAVIEFQLDGDASRLKSP